MAGLLNKITKSISGDHSQATLNTGAPTTENVQHGSTATHGGEPAFRENVFDDKMTTGRNTHGTHGLGQEGGLHGSGHHTTGTTGGLRENIPGQGAHGSSAMGMGHDGMSRHDASLEGRHTGHTGGMHHENMPGSTSLGTSTMGRENMSRHDAALEGRHAGTAGHGMRENVPGSTAHGSTMGMGHNSGLEGRHNMGTTGTMGHGENLSRHDAGLEGRSMGAAGGMHENIPGNTATHGGMGTGMGREGGMGRHDAALQGGNIASQDHHAANPRNDLHTANLGRHDVPGESLSHGNSHGTSGVTGSSTTTATGPVHNSKLLNKLDPRVKEHKEGHMGHHEGGLSSTTGHGHHNTTGAGAATNLHGRDPLDATQVPPSVMQQHRGPPIVEHEFPHDSKHKRHSVSHQEDHVLR